MTEPAQYVLPLPHRPALGGEDFLVSPCHAEVIAWLDAWPAWAETGVAVVGPEGSGKTHLARMFAAATGADLTGAAEAEGTAGFGPARLLIVEDIDRNPAEEALYHLFNRARDEGAHLLFTSRQPPGCLSLALPDWRSRLLTCPVAEIGRPDDALMAAVLVKLFGDRQLLVGEAEIAWLLPRMERSLAAAALVVEAADRLSLALHRRVGQAVLKEALEQVARGEEADHLAAAGGDGAPPVEV